MNRLSQPNILHYSNSNRKIRLVISMNKSKKYWQLPPCVRCLADPHALPRKYRNRPEPPALLPSFYSIVEPQRTQPMPLARTQASRRAGKSPGPGLWAWFNPAFFLARDAVTPYMVSERPSKTSMIKHFGISTCDSLPKATSCTLALEGSGSATVFVVFADGRSNKKCLYLLILCHWWRFIAWEKTWNPTFRHCDKVLTKQNERHHIEREGRGKTWILRGEQRGYIAL